MTKARIFFHGMFCVGERFCFTLSASILCIPSYTLLGGTKWIRSSTSPNHWNRWREKPHPCFYMIELLLLFQFF